jgi:lipoprotein-releasing system ATP-binding protein
MTPQNFLVVKDLTKSFPMGDSTVEVLKGMSFSAQKGEFLSIVGASGTGKTTLLHLIGALDRPQSGEIWLDGQNITTLAEEKLSYYRNTQVGMVFQFHHLLPEFSALENVMMPLLILRRPAAYARTIAEAILMEVGLKERLRHRPGELSGGEQQRVAIARALVTNPPLLLADEPTGNLDTHTGDSVFALLQKLNQDRQLTVLLVTHNDRLASRTHQILHLHDGRIVNSQ